MTFSMKIHGKDTQGEIIAACDGDILGRTLDDKEKEIEFKVSIDFYGDNKFEWKTVKAALSRGRNINIVGNKIVELASKEGIIDLSNTIEIDGIKHAQMYMI